MFKHFLFSLIFSLSASFILANDADLFVLKTYNGKSQDSVLTRVYVSGNLIKFSINAKSGNGYYKFFLDTEKQQLRILSDLHGQENALVLFNSQELFEKFNFIFDVRSILKWQLDEKGFMFSRNNDLTYLAKPRSKVTFPSNDLLKLIHSHESGLLVGSSDFTPEWYNVRGKDHSIYVSWNYMGKVQEESFELKGDFKERDLSALLNDAEKDSSARLFLRQLLESW